MNRQRITEKKSRKFDKMNAKGAIIDEEREIHLIYILKEKSERRDQKGEIRKEKGERRLAKLDELTCCGGNNKQPRASPWVEFYTPLGILTDEW